MPHPIVVNEASGAVCVMEPAGAGTWSRRQLLPAGRWPTFSPSGEVLAVSVIEFLSDDVRSRIDLVDLEGTLLRTVFRSPEHTIPVIAPRVPHYMMWSPRGDVLSYVAQAKHGLTLFLGSFDGVLSGDPIINAAPVFFSWCTDSNFMAVHAGEELSVVETEGSRVTANVAPKAVGFRTPAFSDDANILAYAISEGQEVRIMRAHFQGTGSREVHRFTGGVAMGFRPGTQELTVAVTHAPETGSFDELWSLDLAQDPPRIHPLGRGAFAAFFWSPLGDRLAALVPAQTGDGRFTLQSMDPRGDILAVAEPFVPSADFRTIMGFFDQYMHSHSLWAPDGTSFLVAGRQGTDAVSPSFGDPIGDYVMQWRAERGAPLERIAPGEAGFYPPLPKQLH